MNFRFSNILKYCFWWLIVFTLSGNIAAAYYDLGAPTGFVNDYVGVLSAAEKTELETKLKDFSATTSHEVVVVVINSLAGDYIENFAIKLFEAWAIGKKGVDNGVLFIVAIEDKQMRIEVGYGLEGALTDRQANDILEQIVKPRFKNGEYSAGIIAGTEAITKTIAGEKVMMENNSLANNQLKNFFSRNFVVILVAIWVGIGSLLNHFSKSKSYWLGGVVGGIVGLIVGVIFLGLAGIVMMSVGLGVIGLVVDYFMSKRGPRPPGSRGGMFFPGGGFGGFGGFGGGRSGGGGSSSSW